MQLNELKGTISGIVPQPQTDGFLVEVVVDLEGGQPITSEMRAKSAEALQLAPGLPVTVTIPAAEVLVSTQRYRPTIKPENDERATSDYQDPYGNWWQIVVQGGAEAVKGFLDGGSIMVWREPLTDEEHRAYLQHADEHATIDLQEVDSPKTPDLEIWIQLRESVVQGLGREVFVVSHVMHSTHTLTLQANDSLIDIGFTASGGQINVAIPAVRWESGPATNGDFDVQIAGNVEKRELSVSVTNMSKAHPSYTLRGEVIRPIRGQL